MVEKEDSHLEKVMKQELAGRQGYLKGMVPNIVKRTRDGLRYGNIQSRIERGKAYVNRLEHNYENKFVFRPPQKQEE